MRLALLEISNGLPPPVSCELAFGLDVAEVVLLLLVTGDALSRLVVIFWLALVVVASSDADEVEDGVAEVEVSSAVVKVLLDFVEVETREAVRVVDANVAVEDLTPPPPVTPGLAVGSVTETAGAGYGVFTGSVVAEGAAVVCVVCVPVGHNASMMPPFITIPNNVFELTIMLEHPSLTSLATDFKPFLHDFEHPFVKSSTVHAGICSSYANWHDLGINNEVIC
jgi:hypothetical protein